MNLWIYEFVNLWIYEFMNYEFMNLWIYEFMNLWIYEYEWGFFIGLLKKTFSWDIEYGG